MSEMILDLASHTVIMVLALGSIWLIDLVLNATLGPHSKFLGLIPIKWAIDMGDMAVIVKFIWQIISHFPMKGGGLLLELS